MGLINRKKPTVITDLDHGILDLGDGDIFTLRNACEGIQIFGAIGSGKTSGSGKTIALSYLRAGFGGIVLTGKIGERKRWKDYMKHAQRDNDIVVFGEDEEHKFNPLLYEMSRPGKGAKRTENLTTLFTSLVRLGNRIDGGSGGGGNDPFWDLALKRCTKASLDLLVLSREELSITNMVKLITETPIKDAQGYKAAFRSYIKRMLDELKRKKISEEKGKEYKPKPMSDEVKERAEKLEKNFMFYCLIKAKLNLQHRAESSSKEAKNNRRTYAVVEQYFLNDLPSMPEKTRMSVTEMLLAFAGPFRSGLLAEYFSEGLSEEIKPEKTFTEGKVIIIDFPVKDYLQVGLFAQMIYKRLFQQAVERRDTEIHPRPVFLWIDEAQYFLSEEDMMFQTTARSARACTVMITQNISNYYSTIGGNNARARVDSLLGNLVTKIFHANNDHVTNEYASKTIAQTEQKEESSTAGGDGGASVQIKKVLKYQINPVEFTKLKRGTKESKYVVDGIITMLKPFTNEMNYKSIPFNQNIQKKR